MVQIGVPEHKVVVPDGVMLSLGVGLTVIRIESAFTVAVAVVICAR